ncbi:MAG: cytochrome c biogenesis protein CcdA [Clostridiales bacterium]|nr:cytochrome c biogenesis protein CcdA [Clostridiales bacterium]
MDYLLTFLEGMLTFISPCLLPMLPVYVLYFTGDSMEADDAKPADLRILANAICFVLGFSVVFLLFGAFAGTLGSLLVRRQRTLQLLGGGAVILFGLHYLGLIPLRLPSFPGFAKLRGKPAGRFFAFLLGLIFSVTWTPCVGAFLGSALVLAAQKGSALHGILMLLCYSAGLGVPFILGALLIHQGKTGFAFIKSRLSLITKLSGVFLILMGFLIASGWLGAVLAMLA